MVWRTDWRIDTSVVQEDSRDVQAWKSRLTPALGLQAPERILGVPWRHHLATMTGQWERGMSEEGIPPSGSASPFDAFVLLQSETWMSAQMQRDGYLDGKVRIDTLRDDRHVTLQVVVQPGARRRLGEVEVEDLGSGLTAEALATVRTEWATWTGKGLDLDALDRTRSDLAASLQRQGWYGFLGEHLAIDLDTTGSGQTGQVQATVRILPATSGGRSAPHRKARIQRLDVLWPESTPDLETISHEGVQWQAPQGRDVRVLERSLQLAPGDLFHPDRLADTRQRLRSFPMAERVEVDLVPLADSARLGERPLGVTYRIQPAPKQLMRVKGGLTSRQGPGGEVKWTYSQVDFRSRAEELTLDLQAGLETVTPYLGIDSLTGAEDPFLNSRVLTAGLEYSARRLIPFGPQRFARSNRPQSRISLQWRDENRPKFSRTYVQLGLVEQFIENPGTGSRLELRPFEVALTASRLQPGFVQELDDLGSGFLTSSFDSRALFASGLSWWVQSPQRIRAWRFRLHLEAEASGNLFHWIDGRSPETTTIPLPSLFGAGSTVQVARYSRWVVDLRGDWATENRNGLFFRGYAGWVASSISGSAAPLEKQFYVGGPNSLRGWRALGLGPGGTGGEGRSVRGDIRLEANVEARRYVRDWIQVAAFMDAGNIWMAQEDESAPLAHFEWDRFSREFGVSAGAGIRLDFGYFLLRCDAAKPVRRPDGQSPTSERWRIHPAVSLPF